MPDFSKRATTPELMDTEAVSFEDFRTCLVQLTGANKLSLAYRPTLAFFARLLREGHIKQGHKFTVVDAGCGYGDMLRKVDEWAGRRGLDLDLIGVDMNPWSAKSASEATLPGRPIQWVTADLFSYRPVGGIDLVISSLFTHHLPDALLISFMQWMEANAKLGWFVNDLRRHPVPYYALKAGFWLTRRHRFMRHDGPVSVASAFVPSDWTRALKAAGLVEPDAVIERWMPYRLCVSRVKPQ